MKHLEIYESWQENLDKTIHYTSLINDFCKKNNIKNYTITDSGLNINGGVNLGYRNLKSIPIKFNRVNDFFICGDNKLTSLERSPDYVGGTFNCSNNKKLTTLLDGPKHVGEYYICDDCNLKDVYGFPESFGGHLQISNAYGHKFYLSSDNPVCEVVYLSPSYKQVKFIGLLNDYQVIRNQDTIISDRLRTALEYIGVVDFDSTIPVGGDFEFKNYKVI